MHIGMGCLIWFSLDLSLSGWLRRRREGQAAGGVCNALTKTIECRVMTLLASSDGWPAGRRVARGRSRTCFQGTARDVVAGDDGGGRLYESAAGAGMKCR